jgi:protein TonB
MAVPRFLTGKLQLACLLFPILFAAPGWSQSDPLNAWRGSVAVRLRAKVHFPPGTSAQGEARIAFTLDRLGKVTSATVVRSTGDPRLDQAALAAVEKAHFPSVPPEADDSHLNFIAPFAFRLGPESDEGLKARLQGICRGY